MTAAIGSGQGTVIKQEDLSDHIFDDAIVDLHLLGCRCDPDRPPQFKGCKGSLTIFGGKLPGVSIRDCSFSQLTMRELDLSGAMFQHLDVGRADFRELDLRGAQFRAVTFETMLSERVKFDSSFGLDVADFAAMWFQPRRAVRAQRALVVSAPRNAFVDYLNSEYKRAVTYDHASENARRLSGMPSRVGRSFLPMVLLATTDFGSSMARWLVTSLLCVAVCALLISWEGDVPLGPATTGALQLLLNRSVEVAHLSPALEIGGATVGLLLFALLISIVSNRFIDRY